MKLLNGSLSRKKVNTVNCFWPCVVQCKQYKNSTMQAGHTYNAATHIRKNTSNLYVLLNEEVRFFFLKLIIRYPYSTCEIQVISMNVPLSYLNEKCFFLLL